jgi:hypothetical protein
LPADLFLAPHGNFFDIERKRRARADAEDPVEPFIDREGYLRYIDEAERRFREKLADEQHQPALSRQHRYTEING